MFGSEDSCRPSNHHAYEKHLQCQSLYQCKVVSCTREIGLFCPPIERDSTPVVEVLVVAMLVLQSRCHVCTTITTTTSIFQSSNLNPPLTAIRNNDQNNNDNNSKNTNGVSLKTTVSYTHNNTKSMGQNRAAQKHRAHGFSSAPNLPMAMNYLDLNNDAEISPSHTCDPAAAVGRLHSLLCPSIPRKFCSKS